MVLMGCAIMAGSFWCAWQRVKVAMCEDCVEGAVCDPGDPLCLCSTNEHTKQTEATFPSVPSAEATVVVGSYAHDLLLVVFVVASTLTVSLGIVVVYYWCKATAAEVDAKSLQEGEESVVRDSTAETATLAGKSMKQTSDASYP